MVEEWPRKEEGLRNPSKVNLNREEPSLPITPTMSTSNRVLPTRRTS